MIAAGAIIGTTVRSLQLNDGRVSSATGQMTGEAIEGRGKPTLGVGNARSSQAELHAGRGSEVHQVVEVAQVANAEDPPLDLAQSGAQGEIPAVEREGTEARFVVSFGEEHRGE